MITETERNLIRLLKSLGLDKETTIGESTLLKTDENRQKMIDKICSMILDENRIPTKKQVFMIGLALTGKRKDLSGTRPTKTETEG